MFFILIFTAFLINVNSQSCQNDSCYNLHNAKLQPKKDQFHDVLKKGHLHLSDFIEVNKSIDNLDKLSKNVCQFNRSLDNLNATRIKLDELNPFSINIKEAEKILNITIATNPDDTNETESRLINLDKLLRTKLKDVKHLPNEVEKELNKLEKTLNAINCSLRPGNPSVEVPDILNIIDLSEIQIHPEKLDITEVGPIISEIASLFEKIQNASYSVEETDHKLDQIAEEALKLDEDYSTYITDIKKCTNREKRSSVYDWSSQEAYLTF